RPAVAQHHHVAGVRIGVKDAVKHDLTEHEEQKLACQVPPVHAQLIQALTGIADADSVQPLDDQHAPGGQLSEHSRYIHSGRARGGPHGLDVAGLDAEVQLLSDRLSEAVGKVDRPDPPCPTCPAVEAAGEAPHDVEIPLDYRPYVGPLDLDDHALA